MRKYLKVILLTMFCIAVIEPCYAIDTSFFNTNIPSLNYLKQAHGEITLIQGDEDYYVISQSKTNNEITNQNKSPNSNLIFGEDAFTEDNILKHYVFSKEKMEQYRKYNK